MAGWNERRLENLEAECPERPRLVVLSAEEDQIEAVVREYRERTPDAQQARMLVVVKRLVARN